MKIKKMQHGGYPANVQELLRGLESDLSPSSLSSVPRDPDIETNRRRRVDILNSIPMPYGLQDFTPPPPERPIGGDQVFYTPEEQRFREYSRPGGGRDQMGEQMGEVAAGFVPGLGDAMELGYIGRDAAAGDYDAAGLGALLMLLPGAFGKYATDAYKRFRAYLPDRKRTEAIDDLMKNYMTRENKFQRQMRQDEERILRQNFGEDMEEARRGFQQVDNLRTAAPINDIMEVSSDPAMLREYGRILDPDVPYTEKRKILDRLGSDDISVEDAITNLRQNFDQIEMLTGDYSGVNYSDIAEDVMGLAAGRRGGMPLEEFYRRVAGNPNPGRPLTADQVKEITDMFDANYYDSVMGRVADYYEKTGKNPNMEEMLELIQALRRQDMGISSQDLLRPQFRNEKGGKIPYKVIKR
jgi:anion-transporting  ArsA/GET3 family ATPase